MGPGTWAEWIGATVTAGATAVALYFGVRDQAKHEDRKAARRELHALAMERLRHMSRWDAGTEQPDHKSMTDSRKLDAECTKAVMIADRLSPMRAIAAEKLLRSVYGDRSVDTARLYPERVDENAALHDAQLNEFGVRQNLTIALLSSNPALVVDGEPGPLRRRGAADDLSERARLRRAFDALAKV
jgi:hypothetical protein